MIMSLRRHRAHESRRIDNFCDQQYNWINSLRNLALDPKQYKITSTLQETSQPNQSIRIYSASHVPSNHLVVIKLIDLDYEESLELVIHEINTIRKLRHSNILPLLTTFVFNNCLWNVIAHAKYGSVDIWSKPNGLPESAIAFIMKDVLSALSYLHKRGIIHRAICGPHILVNSNGNCMLTGFKYSTTVLQDGRWQPAIHQYPKNAIKILNYLAPEILEQNLIGYNSKSDIYSVGIVCCELANGCVPFEDISLSEMLLDKLTGNFPRPLDSTCEEIRNFPTDVEDILPQVKEKYDIYKNRTFSSSFHKFSVELCLSFDSYSRPTAAELLSHSFIKQTKKSHQNLLQILQSIEKKSTIECNQKQMPETVLQGGYTDCENETMLQNLSLNENCDGENDENIWNF